MKILTPKHSEAIIALGLLFLGAGTANAYTVDWIGGGAGDRSGDFQTPANWDFIGGPAGSETWIPEEEDYVRFGHGEEYTVTFGGSVTNNEALVYQDSTVTYNLNGHEWHVLGARFDITSLSGSTAIFSNGYFRHNHEFRPSTTVGHEATAIFRGAQTTFDLHAVLVGMRGEAYLRIEDGASGNINNYLRPSWSGGIGHTYVTGSNSYLWVDGQLQMHYETQNYLTVSDNAHLRAGATSGGTAQDMNTHQSSVIVSNQSLLEVNRDMVLGDRQNTNIEVEAPLTTVLVSDQSTVSVGRHLRMGSGAINPRVEVRVEGGSELRATAVQIGSSSNSLAELTVSGNPSRMVVTGALTIAGASTGYSTGTLHIANGGKVEVGGATTLGLNEAAHGNLFISGSNSTFTGGGTITIARDDARGVLSVSDGGRVVLTAGEVYGRGDDAHIEIDGGTIEIEAGRLRLSAGNTFSVTLHPYQANAAEAMVTGTGTHLLTDAGFELQLAPGFTCGINDEFHIMSGAGMTGTFTWEGQPLTDGTLLAVGDYEFQAVITGSDLTLTTTMIPEPGMLALLAVGAALLAGLRARKR